MKQSIDTFRDQIQPSLQGKRNEKPILTEVRTDPIYMKQSIDTFRDRIQPSTRNESLFFVGLTPGSN